MFKEKIIAIIKFIKLAVKNLFQKREYIVASYMLWRDLPDDDLTVMPTIISDEHNFIDQEVKSFLDDSTNEFWIKPIDYGMEFIDTDDNNIIRYVNFTQLDFTRLILVYITLLSKKITLKDTDDYRTFTATVACIHEYVINCSRRNKRKLLKVFNDPLFGNLILKYMEIHSDNIKKYSMWL